MKKSLLLIASLAVLFGCTNDFAESPNSAPEGVVSFRGVESTTRTSFDPETMSLKWSKDDKVKVWGERNGEVELSAVEFTATEVDASGATFSARLQQMERGEYTYYSIYPAPNKVSGTVATIALPVSQSGEYDCQADVLVAEPATALALTQKGTALSLAYQHVLHALKIEIKDGVDGKGRPIERVTLDFATDVAGELTVDVRDVAATTVIGSSRINVNCAESMAESGTAWAFIAPVDCTESTIRLSILAGGETSVFEIPGREFLAGRLSRVVVVMPEVLIIDEARTLIDNNADRTIKDPTEARLVMHIGGGDVSSVVASGLEYISMGGDTTRVENRRSATVADKGYIEAYTSGLASGVYSMRGFVDVLGGKRLYSDMVHGVRVVGNVSVALGEVNTTYTYDKHQGAAVANAKNGTSIYTSENSIDLIPSFADAITAVGVTVDDKDYVATVGGVKFNAGEIVGMSLASHKVSAYVELNGVRFTSPQTTAEVTGLPYTINLEGATSVPAGWTGDKIVYAGYIGGAGDTPKCLRLDRNGAKAGNIDATGWLVSPKFRTLNENTDVEVVATCYHYRAMAASSDATLYVNPSSGSRDTSKSNGQKLASSEMFYDEASFKNLSYRLTLDGARDRITLGTSFEGSTTFFAQIADYITVKQITIQYR